MKRVLVGVAALVLLPVVLLAATVGALGGADIGTPLGTTVEAHGAAGLAVAAAQTGFSGQGLRLAVAVGLAESGGNSLARNPNPPTPGCPTGSLDRGAWQLNNCYHPEVIDACADDLACAAEATYRISAAGSDWNAWTTYTSGAYRAQLAAADHAIAALVISDSPSGFGTPGPSGLSSAIDDTRHLVTELFGITDISGCAHSGHVENSDPYPDANGQAHAIDVMVGSDTVLGGLVATWAAANAPALDVEYVLFAGQIIDLRGPAPLVYLPRPAMSCAGTHFNHVRISFDAI